MIMGKDFVAFYKQLPAEMQQMLDSFGISSFEDMLGLSAMMGIDFDKVNDYYEKNGKDAPMPSMKEIAFDDDNPMKGLAQMMKFAGSEGLEDDYSDEDDPFAFPENCFIGDKPKEYHVRIKLKDSPVPVWREVKVPSNITLELFAFVINDAMGWENVHLHAFRTKTANFKNTACIKQDEEMFGSFQSEMALDTNKYPISFLLREKKDRIKYEYDFGDGWEYEVWLKGIREYEPGEQPCLKVVKGVGECPPEDCGGVWGYAELLEILKKKRKSKDDKERLEWYCMDIDYDPNEFDIEYHQDLLDDIWEEAIMTTKY